MRRVVTSLFALSLFLGLSPPAQATGALEVSTTQVTLDAHGRGGVVEVANAGAVATIVQAQAYEWRGAPAIEGLPLTDALIATPPVFELQPGAKQVVRVALRRALAPGDGERTFRLLLSEAPGAARGGGVAMALRMNLPVFATAADAAPAPRWSIDADGALELVNVGDAHLRVRRVTLFDRSERPVAHFAQPVVVLAGDEHRWPIATLEPVARLVAETDDGLFEARL